MARSKLRQERFESKLAARRAERLRLQQESLLRQARVHDVCEIIGADYREGAPDFSYLKVGGTR